MTTVNDKCNYYDYVKNHPAYKIVVYGAGNEARKNFKYIGHIDYFCDQRAKSIGTLEGIPCLLPEELAQIHEKMIVLICIRQVEVIDQICRLFDELQIDAEIFYFFKEPMFSNYDASPYLYSLRSKDRLRIRIVCENDGWILSKFARKLQEELRKLGQDADIASEEDLMADVNHYVHYEGLKKIYHQSITVRTTMITHVDCQLVANLIQYQTRNNAIGICMSSETMNKLAAWGIPRDKICYVNPAHDGKIMPRKIVLGITNRCYTGYDLRKKDDMILRVCEQIDSHIFKFKIMGSGWEETVKQMKEMGFEVNYYANFDKEIYQELIPSLDYWIFTGFDEGGMGYLDALAAGVKTIVTPQGFHLDTKYGLTYPCSTIKDFIETLQEIQTEKKKIINAVKDWTWENYARKHLEIWQYLTRTKPLQELYAHQSEYMDGIFSMLICNIQG